ncbi:uncharacterized protein LOC116804373 isoform X2 [Drosophila mojavensis]|uniref:Uncharacterized protein n=1 Tax=Drosophila mojavensis TaxID=7230 RepID=A0A0Q9XCZ1_DROMO|nr:uncharacterized protein LOC116804373 isoform X2 [Drosophila mojavensis]KRG06448.1 uncharacterized protein Dmoj_GI26244 [Drosophila mojavensis]
MAKLCRYPLFVLLLTSFLQLILANLATTVVSTVLRRTKPLNFVMSPQLLIESIYPMYLGASGETLREITQFLQLRGKTKIIKPSILRNLLLRLRLSMSGWQTIPKTT